MTHPQWRPTATLDNLRRRAVVLATIRRFFTEREVLEVETPVLVGAGVTDVHLDSLPVAYDGPGAPAGDRLWLQTSPEYAMKRLLAAGSGSIYQIARAFRAGERGRRHNPEFTLLEWYRVGFDHHALMDEVAALAGAVLGARPVERVTYRDACRRHAGLDPFTAADFEVRQAAFRLAGTDLPDDLGRDGWLDLIVSHAVQPHLGDGRYSFLLDFPPSQAALARIRGDEPPVAERFELFIDGLEIANGFHELTDPDEQRRRFAADRAARAAAGRPAPAMDRRFLAALDAGLPDCAGVALGLDRLAMLVCGAERIDEVMAFPVERV